MQRHAACQPTWSTRTPSSPGWPHNTRSGQTVSCLGKSLVTVRYNSERSAAASRWSTHSWTAMPNWARAVPGTMSWDLSLPTTYKCITGDLVQAQLSCYVFYFTQDGHLIKRGLTAKQGRIWRQTTPDIATSSHSKAHSTINTVGLCANRRLWRPMATWGEKRPIAVTFKPGTSPQWCVDNRPLHSVQDQRRSACGLP